MASSLSTSSPTSEVQQQQDRFDALPDPILLHILSFLPTLDSVRTSVLSTRWRTLWTSVGALDFDERDRFFFSDTGKRIGGSTKRKRKRKNSFAEFVGKVLSFHHTPTLHKLRLSCWSANCPVKDWVRTAVTRGVQTLDLRLPWSLDPGGNAVRLPSLLFASQSLVDLQLDLWESELILPRTVALVGLRRLRLCGVKFCDDHSFRALFSSSTVLRSLALEDCDYEKLGCSLEISCSSLQELAIEDGALAKGGLGSCQVKIDAPHLASFVYLAPVALAYVVEPLICIQYVKIEFQCFIALKRSDKHSMLDRASSFLCCFSSARNLDICPGCIEALLRYKVAPFNNLNVLRTAVERLDYGTLRVVLRLLLLNPHLRALLVEVQNLYVHPSSAGKKDFLKLLGACLESWINGVLERVEFRCSDYTYLGPRDVIRHTTESVLELVRLLLGSQPHLEKLVLANRLFYDSHSLNFRHEALMQKVLSFPRRTHGLAVGFI